MWLASCLDCGHPGLRGIHVGVPTKTFSRASTARSEEFPLGRPELVGRPAADIVAANKVVRVVISVILAALRRGLTVTVAHPESSYLWSCPGVKALTRRKNCQQLVVHMCQYGAKWRKSTNICAWNFEEAGRLAATCSGPHTCSVTGRKHFVLAGRGPKGEWLSARARDWPAPLCHANAETWERHLWDDHLASNWQRLRAHPAHPTLQRLRDTASSKKRARRAVMGHG